MGYPGARFKSFETVAEASAAFKAGAGVSNVPSKQGSSSFSKPAQPASLKYPDLTNAICVDAACSGNPGDMEYRGVNLSTKEEIFHVGPLAEGTNNIGEFLALVHALAWLRQQGRLDTTIFTDSKTAIAWLRNKKAKTTLRETSRNKKIFELMDRAVAWLHANTYTNPIRKWETEVWGEIPADFGRK